MSDCPKHYWCLPERCPDCPDACEQACVCHGQFTAPSKCECCTPRSVTRRQAIMGDVTPDIPDANADSAGSKGHNDA